MLKQLNYLQILDFPDQLDQLLELRGWEDPILALQDRLNLISALQDRLGPILTLRGRVGPSFVSPRPPCQMKVAKTLHLGITNFIHLSTMTLI